MMKRLQDWRGRLAAVALAAAAIALVGVADVAARQGQQRGQWGPGMGRGPFAQLNLTADQKTQIQAIFARHREADQATMEQLRAARQSLRSAIYAGDTPDNAKIEELSNQVIDLEGKALKARTATEIEVASMLTAEQRQKMASMPAPGPGRGRGRW